jgi:large subunit ribosomal protein L25
MVESLALETRPRDGRGTRAARHLRKEGLVPAVVYGHGEETLAVALSGDELHKAIRHGVRVVDLKAGGKVEKALIREVQWDHLGKELLHVDFARITADQRVVLTVPLELRGTAPGVSGGGVLDQPLHSLSIECLAVSAPQTIRVNINELQIGGVIHVKDLVLPPDVKAMADPEAVVVQVRAPVAEPEAAAAPPATEGAEPEVIGRQKAAEEEGE